MSEKYDVVIGLEIHAQLKTKSKCFSVASADFGRKHNGHVSATCAGLPGTLPSLNHQAVLMAVKTGLLFHCDVQKESVFARKQYFYPDMPKGYQISQFDKPIALNGYVDFYLDGKKNRVHLERAHMEEDAGKSTHHGEYTLINLNRAGTPLMEIVSRPEITSPQQAAAYARMVRQTLRYADVCDGNLEEGSLRCDCNVSLKPSGQKKLGVKVELKNINSFRFIEKALNYEIQRQAQLLDMGGEIIQETRLYDSVKNKTFSMRKKEQAQDYRYFPEADLMPLIITEQTLSEVKSSLQEGPFERFQRYVNDLGLNSDVAELVTSEKELTEYFEQVGQLCGDYKEAANWISGEFLRLVNDSDQFDWNDIPVSEKNFSELLLKVKDKSISGKMAKTVLEEMWSSGKAPQEIITSKGLAQISDSQALEKMVAEVLSSNLTKVDEYKSGKDKLFGFFVGQVMKISKGQANPEMVNQILRKALK